MEKEFLPLLTNFIGDEQLKKAELNQLSRIETEGLC